MKLTRLVPAVVAFLLLAACSEPSALADQPTTTPVPTPTTEPTTEAADTTTAPSEAPETTPAPTDAPTTTELLCTSPEINLTSIRCSLPPTTTGQANPTAVVATYHVSHIVDGDTLDLVGPD